MVTTEPAHARRTLLPFLLWGVFVFAGTALAYLLGNRKNSQEVIAGTLFVGGMLLVFSFAQRQLTIAQRVALCMLLGLADTSVYHVLAFAAYPGLLKDVVALSLQHCTIFIAQAALLSLLLLLLASLLALVRLLAR
jgi:hypothetical protein